MKIKRIFLIFFIINFLIFNIFLNFSYAEDFSVYAPAAVLYNLNTNKIIYSKNADNKMYPASTTKIMTALLVLENCDLSEIAVVSEEAIKISSEYVSGGFKVGEECTVKDLMYWLLLESANDAANILAEHVAGNVQEFANMMNEKAKEIGCKNTNFVNPNGIHNEEHYTTANDLLLIAIEAMKNETFRQIVSTQSYTVSETNKNQEKTIYNSNKLIKPINEKTNTENIFYYKYATGIKTGFTTEAGRCIVASSSRDGVDYIAVILGDENVATDAVDYRFTDAKTLFETAYKLYDYVTMREEGEKITTVKIPNAKGSDKNLDLILEKDLKIFLRNDDMYSELKHEVNIDNSKLKAPIKKGDIIGTFVYTYHDEQYVENVIAANDVEASIDMNIILTGGIIVVGLLIAITIYEIIKKKEA